MLFLLFMFNTLSSLEIKMFLRWEGNENKPDNCFLKLQILISEKILLWKIRHLMDRKCNDNK